MFSKYRKGRIILLIVVIAALLIGAVISFIVLRPVANEIPHDVARVITYSTDTPDEEKPDNGYDWKGAANDPKKITIPSLGVDGYMQNVGVDQNKEVAVPNNVHLAGWFVDSVRPGDKGLSIIDGHVDLRSGHADAIFQHLGNIKKDAEVTVTFGDDNVKKFKVVRVQDVPLSEAIDALFSSIPSVTNQLNLITCSGDYDESTSRLSRRVIVSTELITGS